jgi:hypothetical protein
LCAAFDLLPVPLIVAMITTAGPELKSSHHPVEKLVPSYIPEDQGDFLT